MEVTYNNKKEPIRVCNAEMGSLVIVANLNEPKTTPILCLVVSTSSMEDISRNYLDSNYDFYDLAKTAVVEVETGKIHLLPDDYPCEVVHNYNFTVEGL